MVLQLYTGAVGGAVDVHRDGVDLNLRLLREAGAAQTVQTESCNGKPNISIIQVAV